MTKKYNNGITKIITGMNGANAWARALSILEEQPEIIAGEDYMGNGAKMTKDANFVFEFDKAAIEGIMSGKVHAAFEFGELSRKAYIDEFTYRFVKHNWTLPEKYQFVYNYMDRFINYPMLSSNFVYQNNVRPMYIPDQKYYQKYNGKLVNGVYEGDFTGGFDQLKWVHDAIRADGISRRHKIITWIPQIDCFNVSPPCLEEIFLRVRVPKSEWDCYNRGEIPLEAHIDYRSWDIPRAFPSNLYGLTNMINNYICGNLNEGNEHILDSEGNPLRLNVDAIDREFKLTRLKCDGKASHSYEDSYPLFRRANHLKASYFDD
jgi:hypothetical protein